jgi:predicted RNA-binding protein with RPS1 domain
MTNVLQSDGAHGHQALADEALVHLEAEIMVIVTEEGMDTMIEDEGMIVVVEEAGSLTNAQFFTKSMMGRYPVSRILEHSLLLKALWVELKVKKLLNFVALEHIAEFMLSGLVHVSAIQQGGGRVNSASDLLSRGQSVKVKVMSVAGSRISLSMRDADQRTGQDLTPHLRIKSEAEMIEEQRQLASRASSGSNAVPLRGTAPEDSSHFRSAKRLSSPERWEIKQLIASGAVDASEYPNLDEDFASPMARAEVEEELDVEVREDEPSFLAGQTKQTMQLSPIKIVKAPDGSLNRAALAGASLARERRELRQQEINDQADSEARDFNTPWLDPMAQTQDKQFAQDMKGTIMGQKAGDVPQWRTETFNKATTFGKITSLSIQDQRKSLPIYKLREPLLDAIREVRFSHLSFFRQITDPFHSINFLSWSAIQVQAKPPK